jgi:ADP-ribose pyrophosphatase
MSQPDPSDRSSVEREAPNRWHGPWRIRETHEVYRDPWISVRCDQVIRPDGQHGTYSVVHLKAGVCVVAIDDQQQVHLTEEFHYGVGRVTIEGVSGGIESTESVASAAARELREELGITARRWDDLGVIDPFTASVVSPTRLFLARELCWAEPSCEATELIRPIAMPLVEALRQVWDSQITHGPTCVALLKAARLLQREAGPP